ncbi:MAG: ABC transporter ATP-binding protein, partial [Atopobiaceae bacterium]|nr:ABC transporter ATP-binding protein [Atopobiaceae bacterium]
ENESASAQQSATKPDGGPSAAPQARPTGRKVKTREQRRAEAEARQALSRSLASTKKRLAEVEAALAPAQKRYAELMELMASEELYNDSAAFDRAMSEYTSLSKKIPVLEEEWLELTEKMEAGA